VRARLRRRVPGGDPPRRAAGRAPLAREPRACLASNLGAFLNVLEGCRRQRSRTSSSPRPAGVRRQRQVPSR
jgi:hypothetical protein